MNSKIHSIFILVPVATTSDEIDAWCKNVSQTFAALLATLAVATSSRTKKISQCFNYDGQKIYEQ